METNIAKLKEKEELIGKALNITLVDNTSVAAGSTYTLSLTVPKTEHWIIDKIFVTGLTGDNIVLDRILLQPNNRAYDIQSVSLNVFKPANIGQNYNFIDFTPAIVLDADLGVEKVEFYFRNTGSAAQTLGIIVRGLKILKGK